MPKKKKKKVEEEEEIKPKERISTENKVYNSN